MDWGNFVAGIIHLGKKPPHETGAAQESSLERLVNLCEEVKKGAEAARLLASEMVRKLFGRASAYEGFFDDRANLSRLLEDMKSNISQMDALTAQVISSIRGDGNGAADAMTLIKEQVGVLKACVSAALKNFLGVMSSDNPAGADLQSASAALRTMVSSPGSGQDLQNAVLCAQKLARTLNSNLEVLLKTARAA